MPEPTCPAPGWIGLKKDLSADCGAVLGPGLRGTWKSAGPKWQVVVPSEALEGVPPFRVASEYGCRFVPVTEELIAGPETPAESQLREQLKEHFFGLRRDCLQVAGSGRTQLDRRLSAAAQGVFLHKVGPVSPRPAPKQVVQVYVLDDVTPNYSSAWRADPWLVDGARPQFAHGLTVGDIIHKVAGLTAPVQYLHAMPHASTVAAEGSLGELANELFYAGSGPTPAVLNLSLGWDGHVGAASDPALYEALLHRDVAALQQFEADGQLDAGTAQVMLALAFVRCNQGLPIAAAGNTNLECKDSPKGAAYPAAWEALRAPTLAECNMLFTPNSESLGAGEPGGALLYGVSASDGEGKLLRSNRTEGLAKRVAVGLGAVGYNEETGYEMLTGTSASTAVVSGVAAFLWGLMPGKSAADVMAHIDAGAKPIGSLDENGVPSVNATTREVQLCAAYESLCAAVTNIPECQEGCGEIPARDPLLSWIGAHAPSIEEESGSSPKLPVRPTPNGFGCPPGACLLIAPVPNGPPEHILVLSVDSRVVGLTPKGLDVPTSVSLASPMIPGGQLVAIKVLLQQKPSSVELRAEVRIREDGVVKIYKETFPIPVY